MVGFRPPYTHPIPAPSPRYAGRMGEPLGQFLLDFIPPGRAAGFYVLAWKIALGLALAFVAVIVLCAVIRGAAGWGSTPPPDPAPEQGG